jgi:hypothetical protein
MADSVHIPEGHLEDGDPRPCWIALVTGDPARPCKPAIRCACGVVTNIGLHHVHADGRVTASFLHDRPAGLGCAEKVGIDFPPEK